MRVKNLHTAAIDGIEPKGEGEVDENNPAIKLMLGKLLVPVEGARSNDARENEPPRVDRAPTIEEATQMLDEIVRRGRRIDELAQENDLLRTRVAELEAARSAPAQPPAPAPTPTPTPAPAQPATPTPPATRSTRNNG